MASRDLVNNIKVETTLAPAARATNATGVTIDLNGFEAVAISVIAGTITDGTHTLTVQESEDGTTWATASNVQGTLSTVASNTNQEIGYIGDKRYIRVNTAVSTATTGGVYSVVVVKGMPKDAPI